MGLQPFGFRQCHDRASNAVQAVTRELLDRDGFHKVLYTQPAAEARRPACRQDVVGARGIVTRSLRRVVAHKYGARVGDERQIFFVDGDVFRGEEIGPIARLLARPSDQYCAAPPQGFTRNGIGRG